MAGILFDGWVVEVIMPKLYDARQRWRPAPASLNGPRPMFRGLVPVYRTRDDAREQARWARQGIGRTRIKRATVTVDY